MKTDALFIGMMADLANSSDGERIGIDREELIRLCGLASKGIENQERLPVVHMFAIVKLSTKQLADVSHAMFMTGSYPTSAMLNGTDRYSRNQMSRGAIDVCFKIPESKVEKFRELSGLELKTSKEFQGEMKLNRRP